MLVTGAAGGMGAEIARAFASFGADVVAADKSASGGEDQRGITRLQFDASEESSVSSLFERVDKMYGRLDHVIHAAAVIAATKFMDATPKHWRFMLDVNLVGTFCVVQESLRRMLPAGGGNIVLVASDAGFRGGGGLVADAPYAASKAGVLSLVKSVAREFAGSGVRINALSPGPSDTPMHSTLPDGLKERIAAALPMKRMGQPSDMAGAALFLCSPAADFVYGASLDVDGGSMFR